MKDFRLQFSLRRLKGNALFLCSTLAALGLFFIPNTIFLIFSLLLMCVAVAVCTLFDVKPPAAGRSVQVGTAAIAAFLTLCRLCAFYSMWMASRKAGALAGRLHLPKPVLVLAVGLLGCAVGFYAVYVLLLLCLRQAARYGHFAENRERFLKNFRANWFLPLSSAAFGYLEVRPSFLFSMCILFAVLTAVFLACRIEPVGTWIRKKPVGVQAISILSLAGVCWRGQQCAYNAWSSLFRKLGSGTGMMPARALAISLVFALASIPFVFFWMVYLWETVWKIAKTALFSEKPSRAELVIYAVLLVLILLFAASAFLTSDAFYGGCYDRIYTSDSPTLDVDSAYLFIRNVENDLRQPLFAVFSAPFMGIPYLLGMLFRLPLPKLAVLMNSVQIVMFFFSLFLLTKAMKLSSLQRVCFLLLCCGTYTFLLFSVMMEQYLIAFFWLSAVVYQACERGAPEPVTLWGAGSTMLTSMAFLPLLSKRSLPKDLMGWCGEMICRGLEFIVLMLAFYRFDVLYGLREKLTTLSGFTGHGAVSWSDKLLQYFAFLRNCLFAPSAGIVNDTVWRMNAWRMNAVGEIYWLGIAILLLVAVSAALNWDKKSSRIAAFWVLYSVVILLLLGWGTPENGLILYALYFGWAYFVLLFQLAEKISAAFRLKWFLPAVSVIGTVVLLSVNLPAMQALFDFAAAQYPV